MEMCGGVTMGIVFGGSTTKEKKFLYGFALVVMVAAIILTGSRGGLLSICGAAACAGLLSFVHRERYDQKNADPEAVRSNKSVIVTGLAVTVSVLLLVLFLGGDDSLTRGLGLSDTGNDVSNGRLHFWSVAIQIFLDHPIIGAGLDAFGVAFTRHDTLNGTFRVEQAHNDYLQILADAGLLGFSCLIGFVFLFFKKSLKTISAAGKGLRREIAIGALAGCFGVLIHSFVDFPLRTWSNSFFFLLLAACATVAVSPARKGSGRKRRTT
jgi:O-antigen ligase